MFYDDGPTAPIEQQSTDARVIFILICIFTPRRLHNKSEATCLHLGVLYYRVLFCLNFYFERINTNTMYDVECKAVAAIQTICIAMVHVLFFQLYISVIGHR